METLLGSFIVPAAPWVTVCPDDSDPDRFTMLPHRPSAPLSPSGVPSFSVMAAGSAGALLNLEVELAASAQDEAAIRTALVTAGLPGSGSPIKDPRLLHPQWRDGSVVLTLGGEVEDGVRLTATPSLFGRNRASFATLLPMRPLRAFVAAVQRGETSGSVRYRASVDLRSPGVTIRVSGETDARIDGDRGLDATTEPALAAFAREAWRFRPSEVRCVEIAAGGVLRLDLDLAATLDALLGAAVLRAAVQGL